MGGELPTARAAGWRRAQRHLPRASCAQKQRRPHREPVQRLPNLQEQRLQIVKDREAAIRIERCPHAQRRDLQAKEPIAKQGRAWATPAAIFEDRG